MRSFPKFSSSIRSDFSVLPCKPINWFHAIFRGWRGWSYGKEAVEMGYDFTAEKLWRHDKRDSDDTCTIIRRSIVYGFKEREDFQPYDDYASGRINRVLKDYFDRSGTTYKELAVKVWGNKANKDLDQYSESLQKYFQTRSIDAWKTFRICEIFSLATVPSWMVLNAVIQPEAEKKPKQLYLPLPLKDS